MSCRRKTRSSTCTPGKKRLTLQGWAALLQLLMHQPDCPVCGQSSIISKQSGGHQHTFCHFATLSCAPQRPVCHALPCVVIRSIWWFELPADKVMVDQHCDNHVSCLILVPRFVICFHLVLCVAHIAFGMMLIAQNPVGLSQWSLPCGAGLCVTCLLVQTYC